LELERRKISDECFRIIHNQCGYIDQETLRFLEVNNAAINDYGYSKEEFLSMTIADIRPKEDVQALNEHIDSTRQKYNKAGVWRHH
jgi:two-component system cell cycle sensor histidine kinase/response regulator CckA